MSNYLIKMQNGKYELVPFTNMENVPKNTVGMFSDDDKQILIVETDKPDDVALAWILIVPALPKETMDRFQAKFEKQRITCKVVFGAHGGDIALFFPYDKRDNVLQILKDGGE